MAMNRVQFQPGLSMAKFMALYGTEDQCREALLTRRSSVEKPFARAGRMDFAAPAAKARSIPSFGVAGGSTFSARVAGSKRRW